MATFDVRLTVTVSDPAALWRKARDYLRSVGTKGHVGFLIGTENNPKIGGCLAMLLDRSENLDGAEVMQHEVEELED